MATYNGHKNWNHWNVSLWLNNEEWLYNAMRYWIRVSDNRDMASKAMLMDLQSEGHTHTPDGAPYSKSAIRQAMVGM